jgi:hypothetical protein
MITALDVLAYNVLTPEGQADVDAFVEHLGVELTDTYTIRLDYDEHGLGVTVETLSRRDGQAFIGIDGQDVAKNSDEFLLVAPGEFVHVRGEILN